MPGTSAMTTSVSFVSVRSKRSVRSRTIGNSARKSKTRSSSRSISSISPPARANGASARMTPPPFLARELADAFDERRAVERLREERGGARAMRRLARVPRREPRDDDGGRRIGDFPRAPHDVEAVAVGEPQVDDRRRERLFGERAGRRAPRGRADDPEAVAAEEPPARG